LAVLALVPAPTSRAAAHPQEQALQSAVNEVRLRHGLRPLRIDPVLVRAARSYSRTLIERHIFRHGAFAARLSSFGARGPAFGENLAWAVGPSATATVILRAWLASPGHRANLLRVGWKRMGIGAEVGTFWGYRGATVVTADFAGS